MPESQAPSPDDLVNADPEALVALILDNTQPETLRTQAIERLTRIVAIIARRQLAATVMNLNDESSAEDAAQHVILKLLQGRFDPHRGRFVGWAKRVARNFLHDQQRRRPTALSNLGLSQQVTERVQNEGLDVLEWLGGDSVAVMPEASSVFQLPFSEEDLNRVSSWRPLRDRIIMLVLSGLWCKVPENTWKQWVLEVGWPWPFPPAAMLSLDNKQERLKVLAEVTELTDNHLCVIWKRRLEWLMKLRCIRELAREHGHGDPPDLG